MLKRHKLDNKRNRETSRGGFKLKTKDGEWVKRNGRWIRLPEWLRAWRGDKSAQTPKKGVKVVPRASVKL